MQRGKPIDLDQPAGVYDLFDRRFKHIISCDATPDLLLILDWVNIHTVGTVKVELIVATKLGDTWGVDPGGTLRAFFGFENSDDALVFKIKHGGDMKTR
jgi:hypothetical protein